MKMEMSARPQFAILGAGAIGSIIGAHLARAGHAVVMLARGKRGEQLQRSPMRITGLADFAVEVPTLVDPARFAGADVLIVATKTIGTAEALDALRSADVGVAFSIQNGVWKNDQLVRCFGRERVLGSLANTSGELLPSGDVLFTRNVNIFIGELGGGDSERAQRIATTIDAAGVRSSAVPDILAREWTKFVGWTGLMAMSVITRASTGAYLSDPDCAALLVKLAREMHTLATASGIALTDQISLLPIQVILGSTEAEAIQAVMRAGQEFDRAAPGHRMSALQDLNAGKPLEIDETLGDAVRRASALGLSLPMLETCHRLVSAIDRTARRS
jgi:2-dehydropantoate 2-reductase